MYRTNVCILAGADLRFIKGGGGGGGGLRGLRACPLGKFCKIGKHFLIKCIFLPVDILYTAFRYACMAFCRIC